jgi:hypothetical protein
MTAGPGVAAAAAALRQAVIEGRYADAERLLTGYTSAVAELRSPDAAAEACRLIDWARKLTLSRRKAAGASLAALPARRYGSVRAESAHTWDMAG